MIQIAQQPPEKASPKVPGWAWVLVLLLGLVLRGQGYARSVWIDELYTSNLFCGQPVVLLKTLYSDIHPPAYFVFIHFWNRLFGDGEVWLRLPALLSGLAAILLAGRMAQRHLGPAAGLATALWLATSPVHIWYSQEARPYSTNLFLALAAFATYEAWEAAPQRKRRGLLFLLCLLGTVFSHYYTAVLPILFAGMAVVRRAPHRRGVLLACGSVLGLLAMYMGAKMGFSHVPTEKGYLRGFDLGEAWKLGFQWFLTGNSLTPVGAPAVWGGRLLIVVQVLGVLVFLRGVKRLMGVGAWHLLAGLVALPTFLWLLNAIGLDKTYIERSALPVLPLFAMVIGAGMTGWRSPSAGRTAGALAGASVLVVLAAFVTRGDRWTVYKPNPDWRGVSEWIGQPWLSTPVDLYSDYVSPTALSYYDDRFQETKNFERNEAKIAGLLETSAKLFGTEGFPGAWVQTQCRAQIAAYDAHMDALEAGMLVRIHELARVSGPELMPGEHAWLLVYMQPSARALEVLADPHLKVLQAQHFRSLTLYQLIRADE
jgi:hypothetical protein